MRNLTPRERFGVYALAVVAVMSFGGSLLAGQLLPAIGIKFTTQTSQPCANTGHTCMYAKQSDDLPYWHKSDGTEVAMSSASSAYATIANSGTPLTQRTTVNFTGAGVSCVDNAGATRTDCTISGGGGGTLASTYNSAGTTGNTITETSAGGSVGIASYSGQSASLMSLNDAFGDGMPLISLRTGGTQDGAIYGDGSMSGSTFLNSAGVTANTGINTNGGNALLLKSGGHTVTVPQVTDTVCLQADTETLSNKTLASPTLSGTTTASGTTSVDLSGSTGAFKMPTGATTFGGSSNTFTNGVKVSSGGVSGLTVVSATETVLSTTSNTTIVTTTPSGDAHYLVNAYYRVFTGPSDITITVTYNDAAGSQTKTLATATAQATGSYLVPPIMVTAKNGVAVTVMAIAGTANHVVVSADLTRLTP